MANESALIKLFEIDATNIQSGAIFYFVNEIRETPIVLEGNTYIPIPIRGNGYKKNTDSIVNDLQVVIGDSDKYVSRLAKALDNFANAKVTRRQIRAEYLDTDESMQYPPDVNYVDGIDRSPGVSVTLALRSVFDRAHKKFPTRVVAELLNV